MSLSRESVRPILKRLGSGRKAEAAILLARRLERDPSDEVAWHLLSSALDDRSRQVYCLERVLDINPDNQAAAARLAELSATEEAGEAAEEGDEASARAGQARPPPARGGQIQTKAQFGDAPQAMTGSGPGQQGAAAAAVSAVPLPARRAVPRFRPSPWRRLTGGARLRRQRLALDWRAFSESRLALLGLALIVLFGLMAIAQPVLMRTAWSEAIYDPLAGYDASIPDHPSPPGPGHLLGTDTSGRDVLSMLLAATAPTFSLAVAAALSTGVVGTALGATAAYFRGVADTLITNLADVILVLPAPILTVILGVRFPELGLVPLGLIYGLVMGAGGAALVLRAHAQQVVFLPYVRAAQASGASRWRILFRHLLPPMLPLAGVQMVIAVAGAVVAGGFISFFGQGYPAGNWGTLVYEAFEVQARGGADHFWHLLLPGAIALSLFSLAFYLLSHGLRRVAAFTLSF